MQTSLKQGAILTKKKGTELQPLYNHLGAVLAFPSRVRKRRTEFATNTWREFL